jgi:mRNA interferase MazF
MISSQLDQLIPNFDEMISPEDSDFQQSGLKLPSVIRISRLAVAGKDIFIGKLGEVNSHRLRKIKQIISRWIQGD